jgi:phosphoribosylaminoimidazole (AIR) synthetase
MILVVNQKDIKNISKILEKKNEDFYIIGEIIETQIDSPKIIYHRD